MSDLRTTSTNCVNLTVILPIFFMNNAKFQKNILVFN